MITFKSASCRGLLSLFISLLLSNFICVFSQNPDGRDTNYGLLQNYQSPEVATFNTYGNIPVSLYTGIPTITIPIYKIKDQNIEIPIQLSYNTNNVKPNVRPGIVGLGWNLFAGGNITRMQQGNLPDEFNQGFFHNNRRLSDNWLDDYCMDFIGDCTSYNYLANKPWSSKEKLHVDSKFFRQWNSDGYNRTIRDVSPDKFIFNFLGYSGCFYRNEYNKWIVDSETPFKIDHKIISYKDTKDKIIKGIKTVLINDWQINEQTFEKFILTSPDGIVFEFGGINAIDYSTLFFNRLFCFDNKAYPTATTWHLSRIKFVNGSEICFDYTDAPPCLEGNFTIWIQSNYNTNSYGRNLNFQIVLPVLLDKITMSNGDCVKLKYKESVQLKHKNRYFESFGTFIDIDLNRDNQKAIIDPANNVVHDLYVMNMDEFKWNQLDEILLPDGTMYKLNYTNSSQERLKLLSLTKSEPIKNLKETHQFYYNDLKLPDYFSGFYDHLGFYNGKDFSFVFNRAFYFDKYITALKLNPNAASEMKNNANLFYTRRHGDATGYYPQAEILKKIKYPTGGYSSFYYEPHKVEGIVSEDRQSIVACPSNSALSTPGGIRISNIKNYSADGKFMNEKTYSYKSGILAFTPRYFWDMTILREYPKNENAYEPTLYNDNIMILTSGSSGQPYFDMESSPFVGYSEVKEYAVNANGESEGYTQFKYTNFANGYFDEKPLSNINDPTGKSMLISPYTPFISHSKRRGKLISSEIYNKQSKLIFGTYYKYKPTRESYVRDESLFSLRNQNEVVDGYLELYDGIYSLGGTYLHKIYEYLISDKEERQVIGLDTIINRSTYEYNNENKLIKEYIISNHNENKEILYTYTGDLFRKCDYSKSKIYFFMEYKNMYTLPIETIVLKNGNIISSEVIDYNALYSTNIIPHKVYKYESDQLVPYSNYKPATITAESLLIDPKNTLFQTNYSFYKYPVLDCVEKKGESIVYLWGYNDKYPIAKIENTTMDDVIKAMGYEFKGFFDNEIRDQKVLSSEGWAKINNLRKLLPNSLVTTYTYIPYFGVSSVTDSAGITKYYDYDGFGRLICVYIIENNKKKIIMQHDYNYTNK